MYYWIITGLFILSPENAWGKLSGRFGVKNESHNLGLNIAAVFCEAHKDENLEGIGPKGPQHVSRETLDFRELYSDQHIPWIRSSG